MGLKLNFRSSPTFFGSLGGKLQLFAVVGGQDTEVSEIGNEDSTRLLPMGEAGNGGREVRN